MRLLLTWHALLPLLLLVHVLLLLLHWLQVPVRCL